VGELEDRLGRIEQALDLLRTEKTTASSLAQWQLLPQTIFNGIMVILGAAGIIALVQQSGLVASMQTEVNAEIKAADSASLRTDRIDSVETQLAIDVAAIRSGLDNLSHGQTEGSKQADTEIRGELGKINKQLDEIEGHLRGTKLEQP
jgi:hypothetical protein